MGVFEPPDGYQALRERAWVLVRRSFSEGGGPRPQQINAVTERPYPPVSSP